MFLLYLDDSGSADNRDESHFVLGGLCVSERQVMELTRELDTLASMHKPDDPESLEFHASEIFSRRKAPWNLFKDREPAQKVIRDVLAVAANAASPASLVACAVHKSSYPDQDPVQIAFRSICGWFESFLRQRHLETGVDERGMLVLDENASAKILRGIARDMRRDGLAATGSAYTIEGPHFVESHTSRCVQLADHIAYAVFRLYHAQDNAYLNTILNRFHSDGRVLQGLLHLHADCAGCTCPACLTLRAAAGALSRV